MKAYFSVLGHGSTEVGEVLRVYQQARLVRVYGVRSEIEASRAATALRWVTGEQAAVVTSIGPGALQALAASLAPASDGIGVWYLFGDGGSPLSFRPVLPSAADEHSSRVAPRFQLGRVMPQSPAPSPVS